MRIDEKICDFHKQSELFGQFYECVAKSGILAGVDEVLRQLHKTFPLVSLESAELIRRSFTSHGEIRPWSTTTYEELRNRLIQSLGVPEEQAPIVSRYADYIAYQASTTAMSDAVHAMNKMLEEIDNKVLDLAELRIKQILCPLTLPGDPTRDARNEPFEHEICKLRDAFGSYGVADELFFEKGQIGNVDLFFLWECEGDSLFSQVFEFSYVYHPEIPDVIDEMFEIQQAYFSISEALEKTRFSFAEIEASSDIDLKIQPEISEYKSFLMSEDKGFYKLMQACAYTQSFLQIISRRPPNDTLVWVYAKSLVPGSVEQRIMGYIDVAKINSEKPDFNYQQLLACAKIYRKNPKNLPKGCSYTDTVITEFMKTLQKLPANLMSSAIQNFKPLTQRATSSLPGFDITVSETIKGFKNPNESIDLSEVAQIKGEAFVESIRPYLVNPLSDTATLRDIHYATLYKELAYTEQGNAKIIFAEGNAGIGKTTAIKKYIQQAERGVLLMYSAPRLKILQEFVDDLSGTLESPSGILCVNSNSKISEASEGYVKEVFYDTYPENYPVVGAVFASGVKDLFVPPPDGIANVGDYTPKGALCSNHRLVVNQKNTECIDELEQHAGRNKRHMQETHRDFYDIFDKPFSGVMKSVFDTTRCLLSANPSVDKVALSFAIQGFKKVSGSKADTTSSLDALYEGSLRSNDLSDSEYMLALNSLYRLAERCPQVIIMVDEVSGDGAGPALTKSLMRKAYEVFIKPFKGLEGGSPFSLVFVIADASLCTPKSMEDFLSKTQDEEPEKIVVYEKTAGAGAQFFDFQEGLFKLYQNSKETLPCCHIVTNSFPADTTTGVVFNYRMILNKVESNEVPDNSLDNGNQNSNSSVKMMREHVKKQRAACSALQNKVESDEVMVVMPPSKTGSRALDIIAESLQKHEQTIYFLQSKRELDQIADEVKVFLNVKQDEMFVINSDLTPSDRANIDKIKDNLKLILMTSSAARGVSFPKCTHIIAHMPNFHIPSNLMEICQLVYRGRGFYEQDGVMVSGDAKEREITLVGIDTIKAPAIVDDQATLIESKVRQWYQKAEGLLLCMMISRSCLLTRIKGDSGLGVGMDVIPLGEVGVESYNNSISHTLEEFKRAMMTLTGKLRQRPEEKDLGRLVNSTLQTFNNAFASSQYSLSDIENNSYTSAVVQSTLYKRLPREGFGLFEPLGENEPSLTHLRFKHNLVYQHIPADKSTGTTRVGETHSLHQQEDLERGSIDHLRRSIIAIKKSCSNELSGLGRICESVITLLSPKNKDDDAIGIGRYSVQYKQLKRKGVYVVHPLCAPKLAERGEWSRLYLGELSRERAEHDTSWLEILRVMCNSYSGGFPAIGRYENEPFLVLDDHPNLYNDAVADGHNFLLSSKLNTLNLMLM